MHEPTRAEGLMASMVAKLLANTLTVEVAHQHRDQQRAGLAIRCASRRPPGDLSCSARIWELEREKRAASAPEKKADKQQQNNEADEIDAQIAHNGTDGSATELVQCGLGLLRLFGRRVFLD